MAVGVVATRERVKTGPVTEVSATSNPSGRANNKEKSIPISPSFQKAFLYLEQNSFWISSIKQTVYKAHPASNVVETQKYGLSFPLLADTDTTVSQLYGVWKEKNYAGKTYMGVNRETFLIDKEGIVRKVWPKVKAAEHAQEVLETSESLGLSGGHDIFPSRNPR